MDESDTFNVVQIIELNSETNSVSSLQEDEKRNDSQAWSYASDDKFKALEETFRMNKKARETRRLNEQNQFSNTNSSDSDEGNRDYINEYLIDNRLHYAFSDEIKIEHETNYFPTIKKHILGSETSLEEDQNDIKWLRSSECPKQLEWSDNEYGEEIFAYRDDDDIENPTLLIYSFKNKHLLAHKDSELLNISDKVPTSLSSKEDAEEPIKETKKCRVGSPIPPPFIPRLNLYTTLSTVTEVTELWKPTSSNDTESPKERLPKQKPNGWFPNEDKNTQKNSGMYANSINIINWMALSPRERKRNYLCAKSDVISTEITKTLEGTDSITKQKSAVNSKDTKITDAGISNGLTNMEVNCANKLPIVNSKQVENSSTITNVNSNNIQTSHLIRDRGSHKKNKESSRMKISSKISSNLVNTKSITEPIEILEGNTWKSIDKETQTTMLDYELCDLVLFNSKDNINNRFWVKNMSPLEPTKTTEVLPVTETVPSLSLSLSSATYVKKSRMSRFLQIFNCCK